jgi:DNA-binding MarR family transcriptional regulator
MNIPSIWEVLECLRRFDRLTTSEIASILGVWTDDLSKTMRKLEAYGYIRRTGNLRMGKRKKKSIEWELTQAAKNKLKRAGVRSFYELPRAQADNEWRMKNYGRSWKRFY